MATKFFYARRTRKMAFKPLSCARKGGNEPQTTIFNLLTEKIGLHWHDRQFECDRSQIRTTHLRSKSTDRSKTILAIQCNLDLHFRTSLYWWRNLFIDLNFVRGKGGFWKKATRLPWRQSIPLWRSVGLGNGQTKFLSIALETLDLLNTR